MMPILGGEMDRIDSMMPQVRRIQAETGVAMRLVRFDARDNATFSRGTGRCHDHCRSLRGRSWLPTQAG
jgi:hypothetical protein